MTKQEMLEIEVEDSEGDKCTIREYLQQLLLHLWDDPESFSGKKPFGDSGWEFDLYHALVKAKVVKGELDEDDNVEDIDDPKAAHKIIRELIEEMCSKSGNN